MAPQRRLNRGCADTPMNWYDWFPREPKGAVPPGLTSEVCEEGRRRLRAPGGERGSTAPRAEGCGAAWTDERSLRGGKAAPESARRRAGKHSPASRRARCRLD